MYACCLFCFTLDFCQAQADPEISNIFSQLSPITLNGVVFEKGRDCRDIYNMLGKKNEQEANRLKEHFFNSNEVFVFGVLNSNIYVAFHMNCDRPKLLLELAKCYANCLGTDFIFTALLTYFVGYRVFNIDLQKYFDMIKFFQLQQGLSLCDNNCRIRIDNFVCKNGMEMMQSVSQDEFDTLKLFVDPNYCQNMLKSAGLFKNHNKPQITTLTRIQKIFEAKLGYKIDAVSLLGALESCEMIWAMKYKSETDENEKSDLDYLISNVEFDYNSIYDEIGVASSYDLYGLQSILTSDEKNGLKDKGAVNAVLLERCLKYFLDTPDFENFRAENGLDHKRVTFYIKDTVCKRYKLLCLKDTIENLNERHWKRYECIEANDNGSSEETVELTIKLTDLDLFFTKYCLWIVQVLKEMKDIKNVYKKFRLVSFERINMNGSKSRDMKLYVTVSKTDTRLNISDPRFADTAQKCIYENLKRKYCSLMRKREDVRLKQQCEQLMTQNIEIELDGE